MQMMKKVSVSICLAAITGCGDVDPMDELDQAPLPGEQAQDLATIEPGLRIAAAEGETVTVPVRTRHFESWGDVYAFAIDELGGHPVFDEDGEIVGVQGVSVAAGDVRFEDEQTGIAFESREPIPAMLGGSEGVFYVGDEAIELGGPASLDPAMDLTHAPDPSQAVGSYDCIGGQDCNACDGSDCISGHSWYTNLWVYKSVGSRTEQSSGGYVSVPYSCCPSGQLVNYEGELQCRIVTEWLPAEPPAIPKPIPLAYDYVDPDTCYSQSTQNELTLRIRPHSGGPSLPINTTVTEFDTRQIELSQWSVGANVDFGAMQDVDGVCGMHFGSKGGISLTRDGAGSFAYCDGGFFP